MKSIEMQTEDNKTIKKIPIIAVCGKGGVGKTVFSALLSHVLVEKGVTPLLLVDADPVGGLTSAIGEKVTETLSDVRDRFIGVARRGGQEEVEIAADQLDYFILKSLVERPKYSLLAMGHPQEKGCFCPANELLRSSIEVLVKAFAGVLIDAEAGIEQINRDVTSHVNQVIVVVDGSQRSLGTLKMIKEMIKTAEVSVVLNRGTGPIDNEKLAGVKLLGVIPENEALRQFDREGKPLWQLPPENKALGSVRKIVARLI